jgi:ABC-type branched-subunit amino acid transport system ATPase component
MIQLGVNGRGRWWFSARARISVLHLDQLLARIDVAVRVCDRLYVMTHGAIVDEMTPDDVRNWALSIINKYLG